MRGAVDEACGGVSVDDEGLANALQILRAIARVAHDLAVVLNGELVKKLVPCGVVVIKAAKLDEGLAILGAIDGLVGDGRVIGRVQGVLALKLLEQLC